MAAVTTVGGDVWDITEVTSVVNELGGPQGLAVGDHHDLRVLKAGMAWHIAAALVCFGGAAAWFACMIRPPPSPGRCSTTGSPPPKALGPLGEE